jgi:hypothetical protein
MSAESNIPKHPYNQALETWNAWSDANLWQHILNTARAKGKETDLRRRLPDLDQLTHGPGPLEALQASYQLVGFLQGWRWHAIRAAREQGHGWHESSQALDLDADQARTAYLERLDQQRPATPRRHPRSRRRPADRLRPRAHKARRTQRRRSRPPARPGPARTGGKP